MGIKKYIKRVTEFLFHGIPVYNVYPQVTTLPMNELLNGRTALITGGSSGIGYSIADSFLKSGASVIITGRNEDRLEIARQTLQEKYKNSFILTYVMDMQNVESFQPIFGTILKDCGNRGIDILVNNAGLLGCQLATANEQLYDDCLNTNLKGPFFLSQIVGEYMKSNNIHGNILNVASSSAFRPAACSYTISKWGLRGFTLGLAKALIPYDIVVNGIAPGPTATPMIIKKKCDNMFNGNNPSKRFCQPEEIANMATILVSNMSRMIIGDIVCMTGGAGIITYDDIKYNF